MQPIDIKCPECGVIQMIDDAQLGQTLRCPKCRASFTAETGDAYGLVEGDGHAANPAHPTSSRRPREAGSPTKEPRPVVESEAQRKLRERMEKWAEE